MNTTSGAADSQVFTLQGRRALVWRLAVALVAITTPLWGIPGWTVSVATIVALTALALVGLNLVFGALGMLAFGQATFVALPAYVAGMLDQAGAPTWLAILAGIVASVALARGIAGLFVRLPGIYFAVGSIGLAFVIEGLARALPEWTGGASGLVFAQGRSIGAVAWYAIAIGVVVLGTFAYTRIMRGALARTLRAIRHDELSAEVIGIDVARVKVRMFTISSVYAAVAGIGLAYYVGVIVPESAGVNRSLEYVGAVLLGGLGAPLGPLVGAAIVQWLFVVAGYGKRFELLIFGIAFLGAVLYARHGVIGLLRDAKIRFTRFGSQQRSHIGGPAVPFTHSQPLEATPSVKSASEESEELRVALTVDSISKSFGGVQALRDVSFDACYGEVFALVGPNGAGKSTLFNIISGVERPSSGHVRLDGVDLGTTPIHQRAPKIGRSFQVARLVPELSVLENVAARLDQIRPAATDDEKRARAYAQLAAFGLESLATRLARSLSVGQHKLIDVARAAVGAPRLVLMDEPAVGLTELEMAHLRRALIALKAAGCAVIIVEHNMDFVRTVADRGIVLDGGGIIAAGGIAEVLADPQVRAAYFGALS